MKLQAAEPKPAARKTPDNEACLDFSLIRKQTVVDLRQDAPQTLSLKHAYTVRVATADRVYADQQGDGIALGKHWQNSGQTALSGAEGVRDTRSYTYQAISCGWITIWIFSGCRQGLS